jgi:hypothetical protein
MVQRQIVELVDDLDGGDADETVTFGLDGRTYEIDLSAKNAKKLRRTLEKYESPARRLSSKRVLTRTRSSIPVQTSVTTNEAGVIREWAVSNGYEVSARGRIPAHLRQAYESR